MLSCESRNDPMISEIRMFFGAETLVLGHSKPQHRLLMRSTGLRCGYIVLSTTTTLHTLINVNPYLTIKIIYEIVQKNESILFQIAAKMAQK